jgi:hypothetical protein
LFNDPCRGHHSQGVVKGLIATFGYVIFDTFRIDLAAVLQDYFLLTFEKRHVARTVEAAYRTAAQGFEDFSCVRNLYSLVKRALRLNSNEGSRGAQP